MCVLALVTVVAFLLPGVVVLLLGREGPIHVTESDFIKTYTVTLYNRDNYAPEPRIASGPMRPQLDRFIVGTIIAGRYESVSVKTRIAGRFYEP